MDIESDKFFIKRKIKIKRKGGGAPPLHLIGGNRMTTELSKGGDTSHVLSTDINIITAEINAYRRVAGEAIFEIGRRLKHVKENDLAHGEFGKWLKSIDIDRTLATRLMKIAEEFSESKYATSHNIGIEALYQIATLPPEQREVEHITSKGETKTPDEMTVKELRELKKSLKELQSKADSAERKADVERSVREHLEERVDELSEREQQAKQEAQEVREELERAKEANPFSEQPYGVKLGLLIHDAIEKLSEWQKEYSWMIDDKTEFQKMVEGNPNLAREFNRIDKFWDELSAAFHGVRNKGVSTERTLTPSAVIDVEFTEVI